MVTALKLLHGQDKHGRTSKDDGLVQRDRLCRRGDFGRLTGRIGCKGVSSSQPPACGHSFIAGCCRDRPWCPEAGRGLQATLRFVSG